MIRFENISKKFDRQEVVTDVSFEIKKGELVVLIGPSGSGKTTLLKIINRLVQPSSGDVFINDKSIFKQDVIELRRNMGYVIQQTGLFPHMTVRENIEIIPKLQKKNKDEIYQRSLDLMNMVGLDPEEFLHRYPHQLSGGQQQRIGVVRALACDPEVILMDEPFSALDPITRLQLQDELADLHQKVRKTIVFVTHDMDEAVKIAEKICIINEGKIVQYDTVEEIMKNPVNDFVAEFIGRNRIWSSPEYIRAKDIMIENPVYIDTDATLLRCMDRMRSHKIDSLLVTDKRRFLLGIVTPKMIRAQENNNVPVSKVMRTEYTTVAPDTNIVEILQQVNSRGLSSVPVVDEDGILKGLITKSSLLTTLSQQYLDVSEVM